MKRRLLIVPVLVFTLGFALFLSTSTQRARSASGSEEMRISEPVSVAAIAFGTSAAPSTFAEAKRAPSGRMPVRQPDERDETVLRLKDAAHDRDGALARFSAVPMPTPGLSFDGLSNFDNINAYGLVIVPPDMNGDVGPNHYVQAVNALVRVYDKSGTPLTAPFKISQLFASLGTECSTRNDGLPIVQYDQLADRWLISQYCNNFPPFRQMVAVSKTGDPTGEFYAWEFVMPNVRQNDFVKFGVWPDGYYMSDEEFAGSDYLGSGMFAFDRTRMLAGDPAASYVYFSVASPSTARRPNMLPSDLDGLRAPAAGSPNIFVSFAATEYGQANDALRLFSFHADFVNPSLSTFTERSESPLTVAAFDPTSLDGRADIIQPAPGERLDANSDRLNYRAAYRNLGASESLVVNQTVRTAAGEPYRGGVRVYQIERTGGAFSVKENATVGDASSTRWIGGVAQDNQGNIAASYNYVNDAKQPAIRYTGRLASEPAGTFRTEGTLIDGTGVQKAFGWRWGDYNAINIDPNDDCTFWTMGEYYTLASQDFSDFTWLTRIGTFKFDECTPAPRGTIAGVVTNAATGQPIGSALIKTAAYSRSTTSNGGYGPISLPPNKYEIYVSARGFNSHSDEIIVADGESVTANFALQPIPIIETSGSSLAAESCGLNGAPDPGENVTVAVALKNNGSLAASNVTATLQSGGGVTNPGASQNYGALPPNGSPVTRNFTFTVDPTLTCGSLITMSLTVSDGATNLGTILVKLQSGKPKVALQQNFDRTMLAQLPPRWTRSTVAGGQLGTLTLAKSTSGVKSLFAPDPNQMGSAELVSPVFPMATSSGRITFKHLYDIETTFLRNRLYDGALLEIKIGSGAWTDIIAAGGAFETGGYDGPIDACCSNPLAGRPAWSGRSGINLVADWVPVSIRFPATTAGQTIQLRWRMGTDIGNSRIVEGEFIDDLLVTDGFLCSCGG